MCNLQGTATGVTAYVICALQFCCGTTPYGTLGVATGKCHTNLTADGKNGGVAIYRCAVVHDPGRSLLDFVGTVTTAKSITDIIGSKDDHSGLRNGRRVTAAKDFLDTGLFATVNDQLCLLSAGGFIT